ncbi:MAG: insulinase family protein [Lactobacillaceae bacterium]|jgi:zinc protease|nr:insulinase family protein [Lactobacillaceae bacterium]
MNKLCKISVLAFLSVCFFLENASSKTFDLHEFTLENGLKVIVAPNHKAPIIKHIVWYKVGSIDENLGKSGKAHLLEHLMFRGTKTVKDSEFTRIIDENGGDSNAFTSLDFTAYHQTLDITRLEVAMFLEADRMENLNFSHESFEKERDIVFQERKQVVENNPMGGFNERYRSILWSNHPYGRPVIGSDEEIMGFSYQDVMSFYNSFYSPKNAILVLSGDITKEEAEILAKKYYGKVKTRDISDRPNPPVMDGGFSGVIEVSLPDIASPRIIKDYIAPSYNTDKEKIYALMVLSKILGEDETSKLYKDLVVAKKAALSVSSSYNAFARSYGSFSFSVYPKLDLNINKTLQQFELSLKKSLSEITEKDVELAKKKMLSGLVYIRDNPGDAAYIVGIMAAIGMTADEITNYDDSIKNVSFEDVKKAADFLFGSGQNVTAVITPLQGEINE